MSPNTQDLPHGAMPCQASTVTPERVPSDQFSTENATISDLSRLDRVAGIVFAVLLALAGLVLTDMLTSSDELANDPPPENIASQ
ncbi:hypothetical protein KO516_19360 [Citreicella sp. C3M06]|uniref:hypothetical protein n=1 Tax=Citreicella sp. C3M06 TaxID=2841564 RepID=UPI001C082590|nr:hypothetical protein [Citreicella sp. C3M06]MBU2962947.1 hypothetical protein [Citreicella sp. C3M06]